MYEVIPLKTLIHYKSGQYLTCSFDNCFVRHCNNNCKNVGHSMVKIYPWLYCSGTYFLSLLCKGFQVSSRSILQVLGGLQYPFSLASKGRQCYFNGICLGLILHSCCSTKMPFLWPELTYHQGPG